MHHKARIGEVHVSVAVDSAARLFLIPIWIVLVAGMILFGDQQYTACAIWTTLGGLGLLCCARRYYQNLMADRVRQRRDMLKQLEGIDLDDPAAQELLRTVAKFPKDPEAERLHGHSPFRGREGTFLQQPAQAEAQPPARGPRS